jgi:hypothetical protein
VGAADVDEDVSGFAEQFAKCSTAVGRSILRGRPLRSVDSVDFEKGGYMTAASQTIRLEEALSDLIDYRGRALPKSSTGTR